MSSIVHISILIIIIALHLSYEYFVVRKKYEEDDEDLLGYSGIGITIAICIWLYSETLFVEKWELIASRKIFAFYFLFPYAALTGIISGSWRHTLNYFKKKNKTAKTN